ncbi:TNF receptor-associated factor 2-like isoform X2 [Pomacea canaliculata]|nr:TNF receptor-associated factor 2-like isoform X2 [Pomacea canaliculata]
MATAASAAPSSSSPPSSLQADAVPYNSLSNIRQGGYPKEIFEKKEDQEKFACSFCRQILRDPHGAYCGHRFCASCKEAIKESKNLLCQSCLDEGCSTEESTLNPEEMYPDRGINKEMARLRAKCPNEMCVWAGLFREYIEHESNCKFQPMVCELCKEPVSRSKMDTHKRSQCSQRKIKCEHCHMDMPYAMKEQHQKECPKAPETCIQCSAKVSREKLSKHLNFECPQRSIPCPLDNCSSPLPLERFVAHLQKNTGKHLQWVMTQILELADSIESLKGGSASSGSKNITLTSRQQSASGVSDGLGVLSAKVEQLEQEIRRIMQQHPPLEGAIGGVESPSVDGTASASNAGTMEVSTERFTAMEIKVSSLEPILSVLHGEMNRCIAAVESLESRFQQEIIQTQELRRKMEQYDQSIQAVNTSVSQFEVKSRELEHRLLNLSQDQADGTLLWQIPNFSKVRADAVSGKVSNIHSRPFYTGPIGYKMCVRLYPNGDGMGKGTHLSLFFTIMRSNHDALLPWPFKQKVYFMLIDQNFKKHVVDAFRSEPTSSSFQRPTSEMNIATGCPLFVALSKLTTSGLGYLKDDTMYIRVMVETEGLDQHLKQFDPRSIPLSTNN